MADVVRERLKTAGEKVLDEDKLKAALELAFDSTKRYLCEHCNRPNRIPMPDFTQIEKILNQMYGPLAAPEQQVSVDVTVMSLEQKLEHLARLEARQEVLQLTSGTGGEAA
jgi:hypothetical protein